MRNKNEKIKHIIIFVIACIALMLTVWSLVLRPYNFDLNLNNLLNKGLRISSPAFDMHEVIPNTYTCEGQGLSPELHISGVSKESQSLALVLLAVDDTKEIKAHWTLWNINPRTQIIKENSVPISAIEGINDFDKKSYTAPCGNENKKYVFKVYSLNSKIDLATDANVEELQKKIAEYLIDEAEFVVRY
jgi:Raf kinase inhibitor-like YbhB/YbcL family protein